MTPQNWAGDVAPTGSGTDQLVFPTGGGVLQKSNTNNFPATTTFNAITISGSGYTLAGNSITLGPVSLADTSLAGANAVSLNIILPSGGGTIIDDAGGSSDALTISGVISGSDALTKDGSGSVIFTAANTYSGGTTLAGGTTFANNSSGSAFGSGAVSNTSGTLRGNGSFSGALTHNATLAPGATNPAGGSAGRISIGSGITFGGSARYAINLFNTTPGSGYDQLDVTGAVDLGGFPLDTSGTYNAVGGERFFILVNDSSDAITGTFQGLAQDDVVDINGTEYAISYTGDSGTNALTGGNDVVLYNNANQPPTNTVPGAQTTNEDTAKVFSTANGNVISVLDPDAGTDDIQVELTAGSGASVSVPGGAFVTVQAIANGVRVTGAQDDVNDAIDGMSVTPAANSTSSITLTVASSDLGHNGGGGTLTDTDTVSISVTPVNDTPVNTVPATQGINQNATLTFNSAHSNAISVADADGGSLTVTLTATNGTVALGSSGGVTINSGNPAGAAAISFTGSAFAINNALSGTTFTPTSGFSGSASLQIATTDGTATDTDTITINVAPAGSFGFSASSYTVAEDVGAGFITVTVNRGGGSAGTSTVQYATSNDTATPGSDYTAASGTLTFADGETSKTFNVSITDDAIDENDETLNLTLSNPAGGATLGAQSSAVVTITDNDATPSLTIGNASAAEGNSGTSAINFTVTLSAASGRPVTVQYATSDGTATTADSDYAAASGTLTFAPGQTTKTITVNAIGDAAQESSETFTVTLSSPTNATIGGGSTATGTILDDDSPGPSLGFAQDITLAEGNSGTSNATFTVNLSAAASDIVTVSYATVDGTAAGSGDYTSTSGVLTFTAGQTSRTINVPVIGDTLDEDNETFNLVLSSPTGASLGQGTGIATIQDDDPSPTISIADGSTGPVEADGVDFVVTLSAPSGRTIVATYSTADGTAIGEQDYAPTNNVVSFAPGETTKTIHIATVDDSRDEDVETFTLTLANVQNAVVDDGLATGTIVDDDGPPSLSVNDAPAVAEPAAPGTVNAVFTVTLSAVSGKTVTVDYATVTGTATEGADYTADSGTLTFVPGETTKTVAVSVPFDGTADAASETFTLALSNATNALIEDGAGIGTITDTAPNAAPVAADDVVVVAAGQFSIDIPVLVNDSDADGDVLFAAPSSQPSNGVVQVVDSGATTLRYTPNPGFTGSDSFTYDAVDTFGNRSTATVNITVTGNGTAVNPTDPRKTDVFIAATAASDQIQIVRVGRQVRVLINGNDQGTFTANGNIVISGGDGDDVLLIGKVKNPVIFNGGEGNDSLGGGAKNDILVGGPGNDTLNAGAGKDLIIGGDGADTINGLGGNDILIAGTTIYDADTLANRAALNDLLTELARPGRYADKLARLTASAGVGSSGAKLIANTTVFDDGDIDVINGGGGQDLFAANTGTDSVIDILTKRARNENVIEL